MSPHESSGMKVFCVRKLCFVAALVAGPFVSDERCSGEIRWQTSPANALETARPTNKPILVFAGKDWCHYCTKMKHETWANEKVDRVVRRDYITLTLDGDRDRSVVTRLELDGYPATLLYSPDGRFITKRDGFMRPEQTIAWLKSIYR